jgi:hypothetical protein
LGKAYSLPKREKNRLFNRTLFLANAIDEQAKADAALLDGCYVLENAIDQATLWRRRKQYGI